MPRIGFCLFLVLFCFVLCTHQYSTEDEEKLWTFLQVASAGVSSSVQTSLNEMQNDPKQRKMVAQLMMNVYSQLGMTPQGALDYIHRPTFDLQSDKRKRSARKQSRSATFTRAASGGSTSYQPSLISPIATLATSDTGYGSDACGDKSLSQMYSDMEDARVLSLGLWTTSMALRCVCLVSPKCIYIFPKLIEIPTPFLCIPWVPVVTVAQRLDYRYEHARFCADVKLQKLTDAANKHAHVIDGIMSEISRYSLEEDVFLGLAEPAVVLPEKYGGRLEYVRDLVTDVLNRRNVTLQVKGSVFNQADIDRANNIITTVQQNTSMTLQERIIQLSGAFYLLSDTYKTSLRMSDNVPMVTTFTPAPTLPTAAPVFSFTAPDGEAVYYNPEDSLEYNLDQGLSLGQQMSESFDLQWAEQFDNGDTTYSEGGFSEE